PVSRDEMAFVPNRYRKPSAMIAELSTIAASRWESEAYPISPRLYSVKAGKWSTEPMYVGPDNERILVGMWQGEEEQAIERCKELVETGYTVRVHTVAAPAHNERASSLEAEPQGAQAEEAAGPK